MSTEHTLSQATIDLRKGKAVEAEAKLRSILDANPQQFDALRLLGVACNQQDRHQEAINCFGKALDVDASSAATHYNLGVALATIGRHEDAVGSFRSAIELEGDDADAHFALGSALTSLNRYEEAASCLRRALEINPDFAEAHNNLGVVHKDLRHNKDAIECFRRAIAINPEFAEAYVNLGGTYINLHKYADAEKSLRRALAISGDSAETYNNLGTTLNGQKRYAEAVECYRRAVEINPEHANALSQWASVSRLICDWNKFDEACHDLTDKVRNKRIAVSPLFITISDDPKDQRLCAEFYAREKFSSRVEHVARNVSPADDRIRIAYLSADFREHAISFLVAELFELHDREKFEIFGISFGRDDNSAIRARLQKAFDQFVDIRDIADRDAAEIIAELQAHIVVDLTGFTASARTGILAFRPAPVQINYLGYPGTMGCDFIDYILVDPFVVPQDQQLHFSERLVQLPDCYQVNDTKREIAIRTPSRTEIGLPAEGFVFCCLNKSSKITPTLFDIWMRLLKGVPRSVLWLLSDTQIAEDNLRREAAVRGVDPDRVIFAPRVKPADYLARFKLADLFLDTLPCNACTTAGEALWLGVPIITCPGRAFVARAAGSILHAIGLPELVTDSLESYEALALELARDPELLASVRAKLARNRDKEPLFDSKRFCRNLEAAYEQMFKTWCEGKDPMPFAVKQTRLT